MNSNIPNMGGINPAGYNTQIPKAIKKEDTIVKEEAKECCIDLELDPNYINGRTMTQQSKTTKKPYKYDVKNTYDDVVSFEAVANFAKEIQNSLILKGVEPEQAAARAADVASVFFNLED